jgi:catechol 2,3-dioxygenase
VSTTARQSATGVQAVDPATEMGFVALTVADLERSLAYYSEAIGLQVLEREGGSATLGVAGRPLLALSEQPGATAWPRGGRSYTGLYHFALLMPTREDLGRWLRNWFSLGLPLPGQGDHHVSEALYLEDPDMHGIEIYRDRPRSGWRWEDVRVRMGGGMVDMQGLLDDAERAGEPWRGMPEGVKLGHMHLQIGDVERAAAFYHGVLGFDIVSQSANSLFVSAGGYHHHIGMNTWHSQDAGPAPADSVRLRAFSVDFASDAARQAVLARLAQAGIATTPLDGALAVNDPWGNTVLLQVGSAADPRVVAALARAADAL